MQSSQSCPLGYPIIIILTFYRHNVINGHMNSMQRYSMKYVTRKTGLTPHTIRVWEKRYGAVIPERTETNRRLYSNADIEKLVLLHRATLQGHGIGQIARLPLKDLRDLVESDSLLESRTSSASTASPAASAGKIIENALEALRSFDREQLEKVLHGASAAFSLPVLIDQVISPFLEKLGELWSEGALRVAQEHFSSGIVRGFLANLSRQVASSPSNPVLLVTTPTGQHHEFGALFAAAVAASCGWRPVYLGPNLPAEEISGAAAVNRARAVALSIIYPTDDPRLAEELILLRRCLPPDTQIIAGGHSAPCYKDTFDAIGAIIINGSAALASYLKSLRVTAQ